MPNYMYLKREFTLSSIYIQQYKWNENRYHIYLPVCVFRAKLQCYIGGTSWLQFKDKLLYSTPMI